MKKRELIAVPHPDDPNTFTMTPRSEVKDSTLLARHDAEKAELIERRRAALPKLFVFQHKFSPEEAEAFVRVRDHDDLHASLRRLFLELLWRADSEGRAREKLKRKALVDKERRRMKGLPPKGRWIEDAVKRRRP